MTYEDLPVLYVKTGCPWCAEAIAFLDEHGISHRQKNVTEDAAAFAELRRKSGQTLTPTLDWHGEILTDFGVGELVAFLHKQEVELEDS